MKTTEEKIKDRKKQRLEETENAHRERVRRYKRLFDTEDGQWVLNDMQEAFGWSRPLHEQGGSPTDLAVNVGQRGPLQHIDNYRRLAN